MNLTDDSTIKTKPGSSTLESDEVLVARLLEWLKLSESSTSETNWRTESKEDYDFYSGKQDDAEVLERLAIAKRPASVYNECKPKIDMLIGLASQNRKTPYAFPVETTDESLAEIANGALKHYRRMARVARNEIECFEHMAKSGRSLLHFYISGDDPFKPEIKSKRIHGRDFWLDPVSVEYNQEDARFIFVDKWFDKDEFKSLFPDINIDELSQFSKSHPDMPLFFSQEREKYRVTECWYRKYDEVYWVMNPLTQRSEALTRGEYLKFKQAVSQGIKLPNGQMVPNDAANKYQKRWRKNVYYCFFSANRVIARGPSPYKHNEFPYILYGAYKDDDENRWFGALSMMKDPQRGINTMRRQLQHLLQTSPKNILVHEVGAVLDIEAYEKRSSEPGFHMEVAQGAVSTKKLDFTQQPQISPVYAQLFQMDSQTMKDASGIQDSLLGIQTSSREPGVTVRMRQETGLAVLFLMFDNARESRLQGGRQLFSMIQQYITGEEIIRIEGEEGAKMIQINSQRNKQAPGFNDISVGKYDLVIDEALENASMRMATLQMLTEFGQQNPGSIPPEMIIEYSDLPMTAKIQVKNYRMEQQQIQQQQVQQQMAVEQQKVASEENLKRMELAIEERIAVMEANVKLAIAEIVQEGRKTAQKGS
jgi:hypothetical protein